MDKFLSENPSVEYFRFQWVDFSGVAHAKIVPKAHCLCLAASGDTLSLAQNCLITPIATAPDCFPAGPERWEMHPDWTSLRLCGFRSNHASVMCFLRQTSPHCEEDFSKCPRKALQLALEAFGDSKQILLGYEIEFILLNEDSEVEKSLDRVLGFATTAGLRGSRLQLMEDICASLDRSGVAVHDFHTESHDQLEITLQPMNPMQAIDNLYLAEDTIRTVATSYNLKASLAPRPLLHGPHNGLHVHLSLNPLPKNAKSFLQALLENMKALCAFGMPHVDSYVRAMGGGAGSFIGWGTENRDLPVRRITDGHWELRFPDATANQYLFIAVVISMGLEGMENNLNLQFEDCTEFRSNWTKEKLESLKMSEEMPKRLEEAILAAIHSKTLSKRISKELLESYIEVKKQEVEKFKTVPDDERRKRYISFF